METVERIAPLSRRRAAVVADAELTAFQDVVSALDGPDWDRATDSAGWSVRDIVAHVAGQYEELARLGTFLRRLRIAKRRYPDRIALDGHNQVQIDELAGRSPAELTAHLARFGPKGLAAIRRTPGFVRRLPSTMFFPEPALPDRRMSYLFDVLTPRDTWMHRLELVRATEREWRPHPHDADIVAQVVRDLDQGWRGKPMELTLTGPAGGTWTVGAGPAADRVNADVIAAMLHLSGRGGLDLPPGSPLADAYVVF
ncbi:maleylpyruvate isomerase family mycothiol-dependent enzyme [Dactylosporangium aurantiacum]|uniref:Maleylpyruvate isomerase family mycothiol-dependent enzyme n=1 Tax=Dactylosporangium aurantiacum TaxID=35754 RepID=A0A9Q9I8V5_9ACTN|nr:maleylpyruvate isomerase family mycothiol-dependent enzyme [Dactylosporangium aurantiacum]MDG6109542.1 maleylpyruvate isomerase family mycothiol-dependent enzyme [Dactylosporangium aurantiacum]UWZ51301.1 maleylpyruvate isomerase family mycothiol-dependent enzyme [Dactylosporangium aurantiacum]